ncbi:MAG: P-type DNA transfer ATPase VirB11 [Gammaproteobacteria bacterium]|nr:MAG: P-type DNA transfer ATPase VirB11 [Gammaproteobacteria bacterium]
MLPNTLALEEYLKPLDELMQDEAISEILINRPEGVFIERKGFFEEKENKLLTMRHLMGLSNLIARYSGQRLSEKEPLLSGQLPSGHRIQVILPPAISPDRMLISIRKQTIENISLDDYADLNAFSNVSCCYIASHRQHQPSNKEEGELIELFQEKRMIEFLKLAVKKKKNILISGATSTGKTTFLNACLKSIPSHEHLVTLEDVPELKPFHRLHTPLFTSKGLQGVANVTMQDLIQASLRIRPDRIIMGELRGAEAADFIHATATGHDGSLSSVHASSPYVAFMRLVHMVKLNGTNLTRDDILEDLHTVIDIIVQLKRRTEGNRTYREVSDIYYAEAKPI